MTNFTKGNFKISYFFWEARRDQQKLIPVYLKSKQNSEKQILYNTGQKVLKAQLKKKRNKRGYEFVNTPAKLQELETRLQDTYKDLFNQGFKPNLTDLLNHINDIRRPNTKNISTWCDDYINGQYSDGQKKAVRTLKSNIESFNKQLTFDDLKKPRIKSFLDWLTKKGVANNSQYKRLRALKNLAEHANLNLADLNNYKMVYSTVNALKVRLNWPEVKSVMETKCKTDIEKVAQDVFLIGCFSGLRISDILTLQKGEINTFHYERIQTKTKRPVFVTLHKYNHELIKKYKDGIQYTRQALSAALKDVLERSGLTKNVTRIQAVGGGFKEITVPKFKEISFHSGRRFYARLLNDLGLGGEIARDELGHSFANVTDMYAGSPEHAYRINRVRSALEGMEKTMKQLSLMKVA